MLSSTTLRVSIAILALSILYYYTRTPPRLLGVYEPVNPSQYSEIYPHDAKASIREVADLYTRLIMQFVEMRYLDADKVHLPPHHSPRINNSHPATFGFAKDVVDIWQLIPYVDSDTNWNHGSDAGEFILGGEFLGDLRDHGDDFMRGWVHSTIDPMYRISHLIDGSSYPQSSWDDESGGPYIKPWFAVLSGCGNHGSTMILDTRTENMWLIDQIDGVSDQAFPYPYNERLKQPSNPNDLSQYPSRPATEFLEDMIGRFRRLEWIPGGLYSELGWDHRQFKAMYLSSGWPDHFDPQKFDTLRREKEQAADDFVEATEALFLFESFLKPIEDSLAARIGARWAEFQSRIREETDAVIAAREEFWERLARLDHEGRLSYAKGQIWMDEKIARNEALLKDENIYARRERMAREARQGA